jgi:hypothetical protein
MGAITPINVTRLGETIFERELSALDESQHFAEQRQSLIHRRAEEINANRCGKLSIEDMAIAFEMLSTFPTTLKLLRDEMVTDSSGFAPFLMHTIRTALLVDSMAQANKEFANLDAIKTESCH